SAGKLAGGWRSGHDLFRRALVDGSQGSFVATAGALVSRQHAGADERRARGILLCRGRQLAAAGCLPSGICYGALCGHQAEAKQRRSAMHLTPDQVIFWQHGFFKVNATIVFTWGLMLVLAVGSKLVTRKLS